MSVLIEGMEMPKSCWECPLFDDKSMQCPILHYEIRTDQAISASCCPLLEAPTIEIDLQELEDRFGKYVRFVVEDMMSGEGKRWKNENNRR